MAKLDDTGPWVVTANRLHDGAVIFLAADGSWETALQPAHIIREPIVAQRLLAQSERDVQASGIVGPYLMTVAVIDGLLEPLELRERIRASGLTFRVIASEAVSYI